MFGAMLLSAPPGARNRNLFGELVRRNAAYIATSELRLMLMASIALDDQGARIKTGSTCAPVGDIAVSAIDPYPDVRGKGRIPPDLYATPITDTPCLTMGPAPDVMAYGALSAHSSPDQGLCLYSSLSGTAFDQGAHIDFVPTRLLDRLVNDADPDSNFVTKANRDVMCQLQGRYSAQVVSAGPDPFLLLMQRERPLYLNFVEMAGCFYLVWSDFQLNIAADGERHRPFVWPLTTFEQGETLLMGFSMRMLRNRWVRWLTPKQIPKHVDDVDTMKIPRALAALQQWLVRRTA